MFEYKMFKLSEYRHDMVFLIASHWSEVATNKHLRKLDVDWETLLELEELGRLFCVGVFDEQTLVGYSVNIVHRDTHSKNRTLCNNDALYVSPQCRGTTGVRLMHATENIAKEVGCNSMVWHAKQDSVLKNILERKYTPVDFLYSKEL